MLSHPAPRRRGGRPQQSLRQEYEEFILQRIEEFKDQLSRTQLLAIADEAVRELEVSPEEQLVLTEVLVLEHVDRLIMRRLNLPTFRRWRERHVRLRRAQRAPTHWGFEPAAPLAELARTLDLEGEALIVGAGVLPAGLFLSAHDWPVVFIDQDLAAVEAAETRAAGEALTGRFQALVVHLGHWFPDVGPALSVIDPVVLERLLGPDRAQFFDTLTARTVPGGVHCIPPRPREGGVIALAPEAVRAHYRGWRIERHARDGARWFVATKP